MTWLAHCLHGSQGAAGGHQTGCVEQQGEPNRTENIRPIPPTDPDFKCIYSRRNDSESINRGLDDTLWLSRAHSVGHGRQLLNLLGYALMVNGLTLHEHRRRREPLPAAA